MRLSLILEAVDRMSGPITQVASGSARLNAALDRTGQAARKADGGIARLVSGPHSLAALESLSYAAGYGVGSLARKLGGLAVSGAGYATAGLTGLLAVLTVGVIKTGAKFEVFQAQLESVDGSAAKAKQSFAWIRKFAQETPFEVDAVTEAFVRARKTGIDPYHGGLTAMGDAAAGANKSMLDAIEAVADAQNFQYERLREFNITSSTKGDLVKFDYMTKAGKEATKSVKKSKLEVQRAIKDIFAEMYSGGMKLQSNTLPGIMNNLRDVFTNFQFDIANAGFYDKVKSKLQEILTWTNKIVADGTLAKWATEISDRLSDAVDRAWEFATKVDWRGVANGLGAIATVLMDITIGIGRAAGAWSDWQNGIERRRLNTILDSQGDWLGFNKPSKDQKAQASRDLKALDRNQYGPQARMLGGRVEWPSGSFKRPAQPVAPAGNTKISLHVTTDRGVSVSPTRLKASGLDVEVNTGRAMAGAA